FLGVFQLKMNSPAVVSYRNAVSPVARISISSVGPESHCDWIAMSGCTTADVFVNSVEPAKISNLSGTVAPFLTVFQTFISTGWWKPLMVQARTVYVAEAVFTFPALSVAVAVTVCGPTSVL